MCSNDPPNGQQIRILYEGGNAMSITISHPLRSHPRHKPKNTTTTMPVMTSTISVVLWAAFSGLAAIIAAIIPDTGHTIVSQMGPETVSTTTTVTTNILDDSKLRLICLAGAVGGAILSVALFHKEGSSAKTLARKLTASSIAGVIMAPMVLRWSGLGFGTDAMLFVSGAVALLSWGVLMSAVPMAVAYINKWTGGKLKSEE